MGAHWNTQKYIKIHHSIVMYLDVFLRIPMGSHHNTATIRGEGYRITVLIVQVRFLFCFFFHYMCDLFLSLCIQSR